MAGDATRQEQLVAYKEKRGEVDRFIRDHYIPISEAKHATAVRQLVAQILRPLFALDIDPITGLTSKAAFPNRVQRELDLAYIVKGAYVHLLDFDFKGFKSVNDIIGHDKGDQVIKGFGPVLKQAFRLKDEKAHIGGDEFAVAELSGNPIDPDKIYSRVSDSLEHLKKSLDIPDEIPLQVRFGVATYIGGSPRITVNELMHNADLAMRHAAAITDPPFYTIWYPKMPEPPKIARR